MSDNYIYHPSEFQEPPVKVNSINLTFDFDISGDFVTVSAVSNYTVLTKELNSLKLNAKNLEILEITQNSKKLEYTYKDNIITLKPVRPLHYGSPFHLHAKTVCRPTKNILEGLYYDITDAGLPRTIISQCQQWGFQRITPCIDDMRAKCTWTVTIIADKRYTNIITNGNVIRERTRYDDKRDTITYQNNMPMPPYLFFIGVGTWQTFCRDFIYPSGRKIKLELLTPTGSDENYAETALDIMSDAILWTHIFTGPERYENDYERNEVYRLCRIRENLIKTEKSKPVSDEPEIASEDPLESISSQIKSASKDLIFGYTYPYEIYREIAMVNSDFGGMENTGNTTIIASRIMPDDEITDSSYEYMLGVKQHEFYHNLNGSSVTGDTPFSIWLNEAVTVMMEDDYLAFHFGHDYVRLKNILEMYTPGTGTFSLDTGIVAMPIEPDGFNDPNDLITSTTYVKAPEFTRMIEYLLGRRAFAWALDMYHSRFAGKNASPRDWLHAMEDVGRSDFSFMADRWLHQTGYPIVSVKAVYNKDEESAEITAAQTGYGDKYPWIFPLCGKFYSADGTPVCEFVKKIDAASMTFSVPCSSEFEYEAWNAGHAAYIKIVSDSTDDQLYGLLNYEKDYAVQFLAHKELFERELVRLCEDESA
ncbi:MAG TPA: M1 family metallopeptidase, partial [Methanocorpusculum sp.]|nr:M1 family metallopeptidase [Methanocorpusculum sp.]